MEVFVMPTGCSGRYFNYRPPPGCLPSVRCDVCGRDWSRPRWRLPRQGRAVVRRLGRSSGFLPSAATARPAGWCERGHTCSSKRRTGQTCPARRGLVLAPVPRGARTGRAAELERVIGSNQEPVRNAACWRGPCVPARTRPRRTLVAARSVRSSSSGSEHGGRDRRRAAAVEHASSTPEEETTKRDAGRIWPERSRRRPGQPRRAA